MNADFFANNRRKLGSKLGGGLVVLSAYTAMQRSGDMSASFEQESNFWYLTGIEHPDWQVIIDTASQKEWLIQPEVEAIHEIFDGSLSSESASKISGIKNVIAFGDRDALLRDLAKKHSVVHVIEQPSYVQKAGFTANPALTASKRHLDSIFNAVQSCNKEVSQLRAIKEAEEIAAIKKAITLTNKAFVEIKDKLKKYTHEYQIEADFSHFFRFNGAKSHAYDPIIAAGKNACTLHYVENTARLKKHQLVLMDVGARVNGYAADISRTYALDVPTKRQQEIHSAVQRAHIAIIELLRPNLPVEEYSDNVDNYMKQALQEVGLLKDLSDNDTYRKYFPHAISHGLGVDVHDSLGGPKVFEPGMVLTVEPGIYIPEEGIGVRIEDDVLITDTGHKNMSASLSTEL